MKINLRHDKYSHNNQVLVILLHQPDGGEEHDDNVESEDHGKELSLENGEFETSDNDVGECSQSTSWQCRAKSNQAVAPCLGILETFNYLFLSECAVL